MVIFNGQEISSLEKECSKHHTFVSIQQASLRNSKAWANKLLTVGSPDRKIGTWG